MVNLHAQKDVNVQREGGGLLFGLPHTLKKQRNAGQLARYDERWCGLLEVETGAAHRDAAYHETDHHEESTIPAALEQGARPDNYEVLSREHIGNQVKERVVRLLGITQCRSRKTRMLIHIH